MASELISSPLPGKVLSIKVAAGQAVKEGDLLLTIEAMKMENEIVATIDGTVEEVFQRLSTVLEREGTGLAHREAVR